MVAHPDVPILVIGFNRPELMRRQIERLRSWAPSSLYLACDGPRAGVVDDVPATEAVRQCAELVDWDCSLRTLFADTNLGCGAAVTAAITWFFKNESAGIILEDDVIASPDFLRFAAEILERYADDERVYSVTGLSLDSPAQRAHQSDSYRFTALPLIWGWATWRRAWNPEITSVAGWHDWCDLDAVARAHQWPHMLTQVLRRRIDDAESGRVDTWDAGYAVHGLAVDAMHIMPARSLTSNVGVSDGASHNGYQPKRVREPELMSWPLVHPATVAIDSSVDRLMLVEAFEASPRGYGRKALRRARRLIPT